MEKLQVLSMIRGQVRQALQAKDEAKTTSEKIEIALKIKKMKAYLQANQ